ncbi:FAD dependent oxidoreductase [Colletotrichum karsti]|uniref:FAD dependent oxidoreductase n=1 Tax=Colletotrichum karsti TaxID=1095194 RepID=A0A9P6LMH6_9PEZI|nr:FAD dependent oxidoreductase [Colletotrichum karsti]KAF9878833.1 FAD dependent oxidoreductase [Colletotrichum karsti]
MVPAPAKDDAIIIVGAGIFGLSTAVHLSRRGYTNVTVFDKQPYHKSLYSYFNGCDGASADMNKIIRSAYGSQTEYQGLTIEALEGWNAWNEELATGKTVPPGMTTSDRVFINNGNLSLSDSATLPQFEQDTVDNMENAGHKNTQLITISPTHQKIAAAKGFAFGMDPFRRLKRGLNAAGVLDTTGGMAVADKACRFALHKAASQGVKFVLDPEAGALESLVYEGKQIAGIKTRDGKTHTAKLTILACGGWTPSILPAMDGLCETTAGSVVLLKIPRSSPLFDRFAPENFPTFTYKVRDGAEGGLYGFPRDENGWLKIGYRGTKYTNPVAQADGKERSVPVTRWSSAGTSGDGEKLKTVPQQALKVIRAFLAENLPELGEAGIEVSFTRVCWYTDSYDNHFVIDHVPGTERSLMVATGGSGHAFKYLPNIGNWVVNAVEGVGQGQIPSKLWRWRQMSEDETAYNVLMEGSSGPRALANVPLASDIDVGDNVRARL